MKLDNLRPPKTRIPKGVILLCLLLGFACSVQAEKYQPEEGDKLCIIDSAATTWVAGCYDSLGSRNTGYDSEGYIHYGINNTAFIEIIDELGAECFNDTFSFWADVMVIYKGVDSTVVDTASIRLHVKYDTSLGQFNAQRASYSFNDAMWVKAQVVDVSDTAYSSHIRVGCSIEVERYRTLDIGQSITIDSIFFLEATDEIKFKWGAIDGAEEYEFEWTWVDGFDNLGQGGLISASELTVDFRHNATAVVVQDNFYSISCAYENGYIVARVRPVGVNKYKYDQPVYGGWSDAGHDSIISSYGSGYKRIHPSDSTDLNPEMNWQYAATFAEKGKRKEVISYYDGSLRNRQSVTRISTGMYAVVGETVYDYEGRPAVNILPVPAFDQKLRFHPEFNISFLTDETYQRNDFDSMDGGSCNVQYSKLKNSSGASHYYSPANDSAGSRQYGFIPNAFGYPMTVTEYMPDATGRIKRQGGVGPHHQLGSGHETKYYYSTPGEQELDRLFGNAVGNEGHYQKEMVVDPNGQVSVSYKDLSGKVIATSLAGDAPDSMMALSSESGALTTLTHSVPSISIWSSKEIRTDKMFVVSSDSSRYAIDYSEEIPRFTLDSFPSLCIDCVYELEISITDECGQEMLDGNNDSIGNQPVVRMLGMVGDDFDVSCDSSVLSYSVNSDTLIDSLVAYLNIGSYTLSKVLRVSDNAYEYYWKQIQNDPNFKTLEDFEAEAIAEIDTSQCSWTCDECEDSLGTYAAYLAARTPELEALEYESHEIDELVEAEWEAKVALCSTYCEEPLSTCDNIYQTLLIDMMLGGQYVPVKDSTTGKIPIAGIFNMSLSNEIGLNFKQYKSGGQWYDLVYLDSEGDTIKLPVGSDSLKPNELTREQFYAMYDKSWAATLVQYHPEYCLYRFCADSNYTYRFNDSMYAINTYQEAYNKGFFDPLDNGVTTATYKDSIFFETGNSTHKTAFLSELDNFGTYGTNTENCSTLSMYEMALLIHLSDGSFNSCSAVNNWLTALDKSPSSICGDRADAVWETYRGFYISAKESYFNENMKCDPTIPSGYVARFTPYSELVALTGMDDQQENIDTLSAERDAAVIAKCDTLCLNQAEYWLNQLGGCNLAQSTQDSLISAFTQICRNSCDAEHPWGARNYPSSITERFQDIPFGARSFQEAFDAIVSDSSKNLDACDPWLISYPLSYNRTMSKLAGVDSSCYVDALDGDTCFSNATSAMQSYMVLKEMVDTSIQCDDCITCDQMYEAWDSLSQRYNGVFIDSTWNLKEVLTNYFNSFFGFNLNYWDYRDFLDECYAVGDLSQSTNSIAMSIGQTFGAYQNLIPKSIQQPGTNYPLQDQLEYASSTDFYPLIQEVLEAQSQTEWYVDTCICKKLVEHVETLASTDSAASADILNGTADTSDYEAFDNYILNEDCEVEDPSMFERAIKACVAVYDAFENGAITSTSSWSEASNAALTTVVANQRIRFGSNASSCLGSCPGTDPSSENTFFSDLYGDSSQVFDWTGSSPCLSCPDCDSLVYTITEVLVEEFGDTTSDPSGWAAFEDCFYSSICEVMSPNNQNLCQNCSPEDTLSGLSYNIETIYDSIWNRFERDYNTMWESNMMLASTGIVQGDSVVPSQDTLSAQERMKLLMTTYGKCIYLPCNYCYPDCPYEDLDSCVFTVPCDTCPSCCQDTTIYFRLMDAFFEDFTASKGSLGNHLAYPNWSAYPNNVNYYGTPLYQGDCHQDITYRMISNRMPVLNFVMEDACGEKFYVNLGYLKNYGNQANFGKIVSFEDYMILPEPEPAACIGTSTFAVLANQLDTNGDTIQIELLATISNYEVYSSKLKEDESCEGPTLCNRPYGTIERNYLNPCVSEKLIRANSLAKIRYDRYLDTLEKSFKERYYSTCMLTSDSLNMEYELKEYHYTLYYYDQAGNLTQTVPPAGVDIISSSTTLAQIKTYRDQGTGSPAYPTHLLHTRYRYNSLNEVRWQHTPDGDTSHFWYDRLGRMAVSQNAEQGDQSNNNYSYTLYDSLGRISEVGQINSAQQMTFAVAFDTSQLNSWIANGAKTQITRTWYGDSPEDLSSEGFQHRNLRSRVSAMAYYEADDSAYEHAVFYDYDIHGNVQNLMREITALHFIEQGYKLVNYDYDLVSGNVNNVYYQPNQDDQFTHRYLFDADNRLTTASTSIDGIHWDDDAQYSYYMHGPLRRLQLGEQMVQGVDYAYTIHGWLKGVNGNNLMYDKELGQDGNTVGVNNGVARDAFGFSLHYYEGDYRPVNRMDITADSMYFLMADSATDFANSVRDLYNGNISRMVTALGGIESTIIGKSYSYDQLNRISSSFTFDNYVRSTSNMWSSEIMDDLYATSYTYDANGNILTLERSDENGLKIDSLDYHYIDGTNQLEYVDDGVHSSNYTYDIDDQDTMNYTYDRIGNLTSDVAEEIESIEWTVYGKIKSITRVSSSSKPNLSFEYTPDGHRVAKHVTDSLGNTTSTWYVRDASGNIMATYKRKWDVQLDTSQLADGDIYAVLKNDKSFDALLSYFNSSFGWNDFLDSNDLIQLESYLEAQSKEDSLLYRFDALGYISNDILDSIYDAMADTALVSVLREGLNDESIADILCQNCPTEYLEELMNQDYSGFLTELQSVDGGLVDNICTNLSIDLFPPPPNPPLDDQQKVDSITTNSTISNTTSEIETIGFDCSTIETVMGNLIGFNTSTTQSFFDDVSGFKTCIRNNIADSTLNGYLRDYYGNKYLWDQVLAHAPGTEGDLVSDVRRAESAAFLNNAVDLLGQPKMDEMVQEFTGTSISHWLQTIQSHFGGNYYNTLVQALIENHNTSYWNYSLEEQHIYGSSRLGVKTRSLLLYEQIQQPGTSNYVSTEGDSLIKYTYNDSIKFQYRGATQYELSNHLGNVLVTITDRKIQTCGADEVSYYTAQIVTTSDYYPFGMQMHNRTATNGGKAYRFAFNGKEKDDEGMGGSGATYDYGFRIYNPAIARFLSVDPLSSAFPWYTPYQFAGNSPVSAIDIDGLEPDKVFNATEQTEPVESNGSLQATLDELYEDAIELWENESSSYLLETHDEAKQCYEAAMNDIAENRGTMAADNLQLFLNGEIDLKIESLEKLSEFTAFGKADRRLNGHIGALAKREGESLQPGESKQVVNELYAARVLPKEWSKLYYASGFSYIKARAVLTVSRNENGLIRYTGIIYKTWVDRYDWHEGFGVANYFATTIEDDDMITLKLVGAKEYDMRTFYTTKISGFVNTAGVMMDASENVQVERNSNFLWE